MAAAATPSAEQGSALGNWNRLRAPRRGVMLHYDDSTSDAGAVEWLTKDPACKVSYTDLILDNGTLTRIAPEEARSWHAGVCQPSDPHRLDYNDANSTFYGVAVACGEHDRVTPKQFDAVVARCVYYFRKNGWALSETWRITTHAREAWPRGRKVDCEGLNKGYLVLDPEAVRAAVARGGSPAPSAPAAAAANGAHVLPTVHVVGKAP